MGESLKATTDAPLTGRTRHVSDSTGNLILLVELGDPPQWRYATRDDLMELGATQTTEPGKEPYLWFDPEDECACDLARTPSDDQRAEAVFAAIRQAIIRQGEARGMDAPYVDGRRTEYSIFIDGELYLKPITDAVLSALARATR